MNEIKPIQTFYDGHLFRSRLEARWAVFCNAGGIKYDYEPEGFTLSNGSKYLPDMYFPDFDMYVEIKRDTAEGIADVERLSESLIEWGGPIKRLLVLSNVPEGKSPDGGLWHFPILYWSNDCAVWGWAFFYDGVDDKVHIGVPEDLKSAWFLWRRNGCTPTLGPVTDFTFRKGQKERAYSGELSIKDVIDFQETANEITFHSFAVARSARFEHGEMPEIRRI